MLTQQEIFDKVVTHYLIDKQPYSSQYGICKYRGPNGARCAVGLFIPDSEYVEGMDAAGGKEAFELIEKGFLVGETKTLIESNLVFFTNLQSIHDMSSVDKAGNPATPEKFRLRLYEKLSYLALKFNLSTALLDSYHE
jgi:hypothetical protein